MVIITVIIMVTLYIPSGISWSISEADDICWIYLYFIWHLMINVFKFYLAPHDQYPRMMIQVGHIYIYLAPLSDTCGIYLLILSGTSWSISKGDDTVCHMWDIFIFHLASHDQYPRMVTYVCMYLWYMILSGTSWSISMDDDISGTYLHSIWHL